MFERTSLLMGDKKMQKLNASHVAVFGVGGVGGYTLEMIARAGVGEITIVDFDVVSESNINRQLVALHSTIGRLKTDVFKERLLDINPSLKLNIYSIKFCAGTVDEIFKHKFDYVVDAIDDVKNKVLLIETCHNKGIKIISAMGAGNRCDIPIFEVSDIYKTYNDGLAKILRKKLRLLGIEKHDVVFTKSVSESKGNIVGSISYYPSMCGCVLSAYVITKLINDIKEYTCDKNCNR